MRHVAGGLGRRRRRSGRRRRRRRLASACVSQASPPRAAARSSPPMSCAAIRSTCMRVIDGDTFEARVRVWPGIDITTKVRLRNIDAPEMRGALRPRSARKAEAARDALAGMLGGRRRLDRAGRSRQIWRPGAGRCVDAAASPDVAAALLRRWRWSAAMRADGAQTWCISSDNGPDRRTPLRLLLPGLAPVRYTRRIRGPRRGWDDVCVRWPVSSGAFSSC